MRIALTSKGIGATGGILLSNAFIDRIYVKLGKTYGGGTAIPEYRMPFMIAGGALLPPVVALYGWAPHSHWPVQILLVIVALLGVVLIMTSIALSSYVVDAFGIYSASAMTIVLIARCLGGTLLPLAIPPLTNALGLGYGYLVLGAITILLLPLPVVLMRFGHPWRQNSIYTRDGL
jgi:hypothetical protein